MISRPLAAVVAAVVTAGCLLAQAGNSMVDAGKTLASSLPQTAAPDKPVITPELRGDIFMAKKQYREAIEAFRQGSPNDPVLRNKSGIAYHQLMQLDNALKSYQQAVRLSASVRPIWRVCTSAECRYMLCGITVAPRMVTAR